MDAEFLFTLTPEEVGRLDKPIKSRKFMWRAGLAYGIAAIVIGGFTAAAVFAWNNALGFISAIILTSWGTQILWFAAEQASVRRMPRPYGDGAPFRVVISENGVVEERPLRTVIVSWRQIEEVQIALGFLLFRRQGRAAIFVPLRCLTTETDSEDFLQSCLDAKSHAQDAAGILNVASLSGPHISFVSRQKDIERLYRHYRLHAGRAAIVRERSMLLLYLLLVTAFGYHFLALLYGSMWFPSLLPFGIMFILAASPQVSARKEAITTLKKTPGMLGPTTVALSPKKVEVIHKGGMSLTAWNGVVGVEQDKAAIYVRFIENSLITVPRNAFAKQSEATAFYEAAMRYWSAARTGEPVAGQEEAVWPPAPRQNGRNGEAPH